MTWHLGASSYCHVLTKISVCGYEDDVGFIVLDCNMGDDFLVYEIRKLEEDNQFI